MYLNHMLRASKAAPNLLVRLAEMPTKFAYGGCCFDERTASVHFAGGYKGLNTYNRSYFWYNIASDTFVTSAAVLPNNYVQSGGVVRREVNRFTLEGGLGGPAITSSYDFPLKGSTINAYNTGDTSPSRYQKAMVQAPVNDRIYMVGGYNGSSLISTARYFSAAAASFTNLANMPATLNGHYAVMYGSDVYVVGGWTGITVNPYIYKYTPGTNAWSTETTTPIPTVWNGATIYNDRIVAGVGLNGKQCLMVYNLTNKTWKIVPLPIARRQGCGFIGDNLTRKGIILFGGVVNGTVDNMPAADCYSTSYLIPEEMFL